jgi:hexokinase
VSAILNDSVGVLAAARYHDPATDAGVILGTGTNACIVERVERLSKWRAPAGTPPGAMTAINTEWGCYASQFLPRTPEDLALDAASGPCKGARSGWGGVGFVLRGEFAVCKLMLLI